MAENYAIAGRQLRTALILTDALLRMRAVRVFYHGQAAAGSINSGRLAAAMMQEPRSGLCPLNVRPAQRRQAHSAKKLIPQRATQAAAEFPRAVELLIDLWASLLEVPERVVMIVAALLWGLTLLTVLLVAPILQQAASLIYQCLL